VTDLPKLPSGPEVLSAIHELVIDDYAGNQSAVAEAMGIDRRLYWQRRRMRCSLALALEHGLAVGVLAQTQPDGAVALWRQGKSREKVLVRADSTLA